MAVSFQKYLLSSIFLWWRHFLNFQIFTQLWDGTCQDYSVFRQVNLRGPTLSWWDCLLLDTSFFSIKILLTADEALNESSFASMWNTINGSLNWPMRCMLGRNLDIKVGTAWQDLGLKTLLVRSYSRKEKIEG